MIRIAAVTGREVVVVNIVTSIATSFIVSTGVVVAMILRPPRPPSRTKVRVGMCPAVSASAAASVAPD
eukprot:6675574-Pyramimonas_sp.AAC.1